MLNSHLNHFASANPSYLSSSFSAIPVTSRMMSRLAQLSQQKQWILYTAQCPRPQYHELAAHHIQCEKIIHMKASQSHSEIEIVSKAICSGNASAIIASGEIDIVSQKLLAQMAKEHQCEVFFLTHLSSSFH